MKTMKSLICLLLVLAILCSFGMLSFSAQAKDTDNYDFKDNSDFLQFFRPIEDGLLVFCATMDTFPAADAFDARMAGKQVTVMGLESAKDEPVTYYCLVDVSGSINSLQLLMAKQMLQGLCDSLKADDRMLIDTFAEKHHMSEYLKDRDLIRKEIDNMSTTALDTNLYRGIAEALEELNTNADLAGQRKALVVFSDGLDDITADAGRTRQEAEKKIDDTRIPIYCMLPPSSERDAGKTLGSFSRRSVGGEAYYLSGSNLTEKQIGEAIAADMKNDKILRLDLTGFAPKDDEFLLAVQYTDALGNTYGDALTVISKVLSLRRVADVNTTSAPAIVSSELNYTEDRSGLWMKIGLGVLCAVAAGLVIWLITKKKKDEKRRQKEEEAARQRREAEERRARMNQAAGMGAAAAAGAAAQNNWNPDPFSTGSANAGAAGKKVRFIAVGPQTFTKEISLQDGRQTTVGRNKKADVILNDSDPRLSGVHFMLLMKNNRLSIKDAGSTNGTAVNGIQIKQNPIELHSGETVSAGSYQYRVQF